EGPVLTVLPGSRTGEVTRLAPVFGVALGQLVDLMPRVVVPVAGSVEAVVAEAVADWPVSITLLKRDVGEAASDFEERKRLAFAASDAALAASGTVALELAHAGAPMVVAYRMAPLTMAILRRMVRIGRYSLPNIIAGRDVVPELIQQDCTPGRIAAALRPLLSGGPEADGQRDAFDEIMRTLGRGGPSPAERAAESLLSVLRR
ncbi:MAG: lipid-A-disaccharide synthase, partial [Rubricella sp.]